MRDWYSSLRRLCASSVIIRSRFPLNPHRALIVTVVVLVVVVVVVVFSGVRINFLLLRGEKRKGTGQLRVARLFSSRVLIQRMPRFLPKCVVFLESYWCQFSCTNRRTSHRIFAGHFSGFNAKRMQCRLRSLSEAIAYTFVFGDSCYVLHWFIESGEMYSALKNRKMIL